jgi:hypothetical protein
MQDGSWESKAESAAFRTSYYSTRGKENPSGGIETHSDRGDRVIIAKTYGLFGAC